MQREECIYNLIPKVVVAPAKPERYRSKHDPSVNPTGSTFGLHGKTRLIGSNVGDDTKVDRRAGAKTIGRSSDKPDPKGFTKKGERCSTTVDPAKKPTKFDYDGPKRPSVVKRDEKPIMGLKSSKNFVTANAVEAILAVPGTRARVTREPPQYVKKEDYGQVPKYLNQVKDEIERENEMIEEFVRQNKNIMEEDEGGRAEPMDERERKHLVDALKAKWDHVNAKYQKLCHNVVFDTLGKVRRKETFEKELTQLEKDIELLSKGQVVVSKDYDYQY
ncbi:hypothetical protein Poli38472_004696 [Pythium oligandrum]|uniref:Enkurin domain-containing protein n=1 Tax=Pythium oligandrum TaxID=41045 RepID=A0A8K1FHD5_PYTOL|nr:hypothetical protein Poli38472_004696 [Pythium oligandrum]|eukprot:TMW59627.1 hypothetical protein Poli38472_004696 [Pythium oligandrum]